MFLTTDPYACNGAVSHANDWLLLRPIFKDGRLIAYASMFGHMTDIGGKVPGSLPTDARQIFEGGHSRSPDQDLQGRRAAGRRSSADSSQLPPAALERARDFNAIVAAIRTAEKRVLEMAERFGDDVYYSALEELLDRNKRAMGTLINMTVPETKQYFEDYICDDGLGMGPYRIKCAMWREGEKVIFDFEGTDPQSISSVNFYLNEEMFKMFAGVYMIMVFDPQIMFNDGFYDLMDVRIPEGTLLKPRFPAALSCRTHALGRIFDILGGLLGQGNPDFPLCGRLLRQPSLHVLGLPARRRRVVSALPDRLLAAFPASPSATAPTAIRCGQASPTCPTSSWKATSRCALTCTRPCRTAAGPGLHRGGNALRVGYRFLEPGEISIHDDRWLTYPWGVNGGLPGQRSRKILHRTDGSEELLQSKCDRIKVEPGDLLYFDTWGGGGWGDPLKRPAEQVGFDVAAGLVSADGARRYGVVCDEEGEVDEGATEKLRTDMAAERGDTLLFDFGGTPG